MIDKLKAVMIVAMGLEAESEVRAAHAKRMADSAKAGPVPAWADKEMGHSVELFLSAFARVICNSIPFG